MPGLFVLRTIVPFTSRDCTVMTAIFFMIRSPLPGTRVLAKRLFFPTILGYYKTKTRVFTVVLLLPNTEET